MSKEHRSEDERINALEQAIPALQNSLEQLHTSVSTLHQMRGPVGDFVQFKGRPVDAALFEQFLALLRSLYVLPAPMLMPPPPKTPQMIQITRLSTDPRDRHPCYEVRVEDARLDGDQLVALKFDPMYAITETPCAEIVTSSIVSGQAILVICCNAGRFEDCVQKQPQLNFLPRNKSTDDNNAIVIAKLSLMCGKTA